MTQIYILYYLETPSSMFRSKQNNKEKNCDPSLQDWSCCKYQKCGAGQGHCSDDTDCAANLFCGKGNCAAGNSSMNCCEGETNKLVNVFLKTLCALEKSCDPAKKDMSCCTLYPKCGLGQGHCHHDTVCEGNLVCGNKNCGSGKSKMNCCKGI